MLILLFLPKLLKANKSLKIAKYNNKYISKNQRWKKKFLHQKKNS